MAPAHATARAILDRLDREPGAAEGVRHHALRRLASPRATASGNDRSRAPAQPQRRPARGLGPATALTLRLVTVAGAGFHAWGVQRMMGGCRAAGIGAPGRGRPATALTLRLVTVAGVAGAGFHAWGVQRQMGGCRHWRRNVTDGPPLPAPPSFVGLALAGLAALGLLRAAPSD